MSLIDELRDRGLWVIAIRYPISSDTGMVIKTELLEAHTNEAIAIERYYYHQADDHSERETMIYHPKYEVWALRHDSDTPKLIASFDSQPLAIGYATAYRSNYQKISICRTGQEPDFSEPPQNEPEESLGDDIPF